MNAALEKSLWSEGLLKSIERQCDSYDYETTNDDRSALRSFNYFSYPPCTIVDPSIEGRTWDGFSRLVPKYHIDR